MPTYDIYGIGNALVDVEYMVSEELLLLTGYPKGNMTLTNLTKRRALSQLLEEKCRDQALKFCGGGSAANTLVAASQSGSKTFYSCKVGNDDRGKFFLEEIRDQGIASNSVAQHGYTGECISMVTPDAERTMVTNLGISEEFSESDLKPEALRESKILYIEGYLIGSREGLNAVLKAQTIAKSAGVKIALTLSDPAMVNNFKTSFNTIFNLGIDILFCNDEEAMLWTNTTTREKASLVIRESCPAFAITCGKDGVIISDGDKTSHIPGVLVTPVDTTGAGDNFAGAFLARLCQGFGFKEAAIFANRSASILVKHFGSRYSASMLEELKNS